MTGFLELADGRKVPVRDGMVLGRVAGCDVVIEDTKASRKHARVSDVGGVVEIEDLGSSNGTLLNGKPVQRRMLRDGDEVQIGSTRIVYRAATVAAAVAAPVDAVDLFGDDDDEPLVAKSSVPPADEGAKAPVPARVEPTASRHAPPPSKPSPPPPSGTDVVEFADEVVEVRQQPRLPAAAPQQPATAAAAGGVAMQQKQRVLQFHAPSGRGGPLGDDLAQLSSGMRALVWLGVFAGAGVVVWLLVNLMS